MKIRYFLSILIAVISLASCDNDEPAPAPPAGPGRTVLVYMAADNSLGSRGYDALDIDEMIAGAKNLAARDRLLVFHSPRQGRQSLFEITAAGRKEIMTFTDGRLAVEATRMREVLEAVRSNAPSASYGLVLWSHGNGWLNDGIGGDGDLPQRSFGEEKGMTMNIETLATILGEFGGVDFIYFDCCYMGSVESAYALRHVTRRIVSSPTELPLRGMPYDVNVPHFFAQPSADLRAAATATFDFYNALSGSSRTCTMSVTETAGLDALAASCAEIYRRSPSALPAGYEPQRFMDVLQERCYYFDLYDYIHALCYSGAGTPRFDGADVCFNKFAEAFGNTVSYAAATPMLWNSVSLSRHHGLSTFIFLRDSSSSTYRYSTLEWYNDVAVNIDHKQV